MILASVQMLHIPDGFLSLGIALICWAAASAVLALAVRKARDLFDERLVPLAGMMAAFIFAAQMINFPVTGGTSGHLIGATLAAIVLGPWLGILVMTAVIILQAVLFQDGGLVVMGANILVMGVVPALVSFGLYRGVIHRSRRIKLGTAILAAWLSVMSAALVTALLLGFSGTTSLRIAVPAMLGIHAFIGIGEAIITMAALSFMMKTRPQVLKASTKAGGRGWIAGGIIFTAFTLLLSPFASRLPDGLEWVAGENGFLKNAQTAPFRIFADYAITPIGKGNLSTILAGAAGALLVAGLVYLAARLLKRS